MCDKEVPDENCMNYCGCFFVRYTTGRENGLGDYEKITCSLYGSSMRIFNNR